MLIIGTLFFTICNLLGHDDSNGMPSDQMSMENTGRKHTYIGFTGSHYVFLCRWCKEYTGASGSVVTHMHNTCPKRPNTLICRECVEPVELKNFKEIYDHHIEKHGAAKRWQCPACWRPIQQRNFLFHYGPATHLANAHIFDGFNPPKDFKIGHSGVPFSKLRQENKISDSVQGTFNAPAHHSTESNLYKLAIGYILHKPEDDTSIYSIQDTMTEIENDTLPKVNS
jgi:hypothetical protein